MCVREEGVEGECMQVHKCVIVCTSEGGRVYAMQNRLVNVQMYA